MADVDDHPRSLSAWLDLLEPLQPPVDAEARNQALQTLAAGDSTHSVAAAVAIDPALVLLLFRAANQALARYDRAAHTLDHAIGLLGAGRVQALLEQAPLLNPDHPYATSYRQALLRSQHAAQQAKRWAEGTGLWPAEEVFWSTLIAAAPLWPLWLIAGPTCDRIEQLRAQQGAVSTTQMKQLLGCTSHELAAAVAKRWLLPEMSHQSWQRKIAGSLRQWVGLERAARLGEPPVFASNEAHELCHHPALIVAVANTLAAEADWDWHSRRCLRLLNIAATACRRPLATIVANCHQTAAAVSRDYADSGLLTPAAKLLGHWRHAWFWVPPQTAVAAVPAVPPPAPATQPSSADNPARSDGSRTVTLALQRLRTPGALTGTREALELAVEALHSGLGLQRVAALLVRAGSGELQTVLSAGAEQAPALRQFRFHTPNNQLLTQLLSKPTCLRLNADNRSKFWPHLPEEFRAAFDCEQFLLMAAFTGERPTAMLYADNALAARPPSDKQHLLFKQVCQHLSACLTQLAANP